ncbi:hypothetical protein CYMTET_41762 [Cymbomonas tetramitiformis]|uniref:Uncharacterized protein n=1 Tax=Cymbomonas tetramitiformis TaxID=36881 RepID=A0AAE0F397_9CHLO|nr:hypothetical protein CYMTET_41762 [Cymbomonas tetramitiformis]
MGLTKVWRVSSAAWLGGFAQVWEDMRELFPRVTVGAEDLKAESDLPYVNSLQAAMHKLSEAVEVDGAGLVGGMQKGMNPDWDPGEAARGEGTERLALMDRTWEDAIDGTDYATQDRPSGGTLDSEGTQHEQSGQASGVPGTIASRLLESMEDVRQEAAYLRIAWVQGEGTTEGLSGGARAGPSGINRMVSSVEDILMVRDDLSSPGLEGGVWTQKEDGASPGKPRPCGEAWPL